jgi:hypothetical protein
LKVIDYQLWALKTISKFINYYYFLLDIRHAIVVPLYRYCNDTLGTAFISVMIKRKQNAT